MKALALLLLLVPADASEARFLDRLARRAYAQGQFGEALTLFSEIAEVSPTPRNVYNTALTAELAGDREFAFSLFERYLAMTHGESQERTRATQRRNALAKALALIDLRTDPPGAQIRIDGRDREGFERTPATLALPPGRHRIEAYLPDYHPGTAEVEMALGKRVECSLDLRRRTGRLRVEIDGDVQQPTARVKDAETVERVTIGEAQELPAGRYLLEVEAPNFKPYSGPIMIGPDQLELRKVTLVPLPPKLGKLLVRTGRQRLEVWIDGVLKAQTPIAVQVEAGYRELQVKSGTEIVWSDLVQVEPEGSVLVDIDPETLPSPETP